MIISLQNIEFKETNPMTAIWRLAKMQNQNERADIPYDED
jgi:hypothetical protein